jgi:6-phosphogluconate dehydrogenase
MICRSTVSPANQIQRLDIWEGPYVRTDNQILIYKECINEPPLWTALTQAQRDTFGVHRYRRIDRDGTFHSDWS